MIELTEQQKRAFYSQGYFNRYKMYFPDLDLTIDNETIHTESVKIEESICGNEDLTLGGCIASSCEFEVSEILQNDLSGMEFISTLETVDDEGNVVAEIPMGKYRVYSAGMVDDRDYKRVVAYDAMHNASASISDWYEGLFPVISSNAVTKTDDNGTEITVIVKNYGTTTLKAMRESLLQHLEIPYEEQSLINDDMIVSKSLQPSGDNCTGLMMLKWMCEIHGGFGRMNRNGRFEVTTLQSSGLYPDEDRYPDLDLYPENGNTSSVALGVSDEEPRAEYITAKFEEYMTKYITGINVRTEDDDVGCTVGTTENPYIISGNALLFGKTAAELKPIAENILNVIKDIIYRPNTTELIGLPYVEVGDVYSVEKEDVVESYVLSRTLSGIQLLRDTYEAKGSETRSNNVSDSSELIRTKAKILKIQKDIDGVRIEMSDLEEETSSQYEQTNNTIVLKVTDKGNLVQVSLGSDPEKGTKFKVGANNIELSADEVIELLSGGTINLSAGEGITIEAPNFQLSKEIIKILTKNFTLDEEGNVTAANITITGGSIKIVSDSNEPLIEMQYGTGDNMVTAGLSPEGVYYTNVTDTWEERSTSGLMTKYRTAVSTEHKNGTWQTNMIKQHTFGDAQDWETIEEYPAAEIAYHAVSGKEINRFYSSQVSSYFASTAPFFDAVDLWKIDTINWVMANGFTINDAYTSCFKLADGVVHLAMDVRGTIPAGKWTTVAMFLPDVFAGFNIAPVTMNAKQTVMYPILTSQSGAGAQAVARLTLIGPEVGIEIYQYGTAAAEWAQITMDYCIELKESD